MKLPFSAKNKYKVAFVLSVAAGFLMTIFHSFPFSPSIGAMELTLTRKI
jgi:hypothetical protein